MTKSSGAVQGFDHGLVDLNVSPRAQTLHQSAVQSFLPLSKQSVADRISLGWKVFTVIESLFHAEQHDSGRGGHRIADRPGGKAADLRLDRRVERNPRKARAPGDVRLRLHLHLESARQGLEPGACT